MLIDIIKIEDAKKLVEENKARFMSWGNHTDYMLVKEGRIYVKHSDGNIYEWRKYP
jgi:hypothetical protein